MKQFAVIHEDNEWEGERWTHVIPGPWAVGVDLKTELSPGDVEAAVDLLGELPDFEVYWTNNPPEPWSSGSGYIDECVHLGPEVLQAIADAMDDPLLDQDDLGIRLYKGAIRRIRTVWGSDRQEERT